MNLQPHRALAMAIVLEHLWGHVLGGTAGGVRPVLHLLGETKVNHFHVALDVKQDVLRLQIAVDVVLAVQRLEG